MSLHFFGLPENTYPLSEVCELIDANEGRQALNEWIANRFSRLNPKGALLALPRFHWKAIYTVNFDNLVEMSYQEDDERVQTLVPLYSDRDPISRLKSDQVPFYKLHGCITRANAEDGRLVLTQEDYVRVHEGRRRLFNRLVDDLSDSTILYVGFRRQDPDFTRILLDVERASGQLVGLRRSYALQPGHNEFEARRWEQKRVLLVDAAAAEFFAALEQRVPPAERLITSSRTAEKEVPSLAIRKPKVTPDLVREIERDYELLDERAFGQTPNSEEFFLGAPPNWGAIAASVDAGRDIADDLVNQILQDPLLDRRGTQLVLVHAEAGTGKTTLLRRTGADLALTWGCTVLSLKPYGALRFLELDRLMVATEERLYVLVDDASGVARELKELLTAARHAKSKLTVVAAARTNEWREVQEDFSISGAEEFEIGRLSRREIEEVIQRLTQHNALGLLAGASEEAKISAFETRADKQLLVALREATEGRAFDEIIVDEYDRIPGPDGQRAYLLVSALHRLGIPTRIGLLRRALGIPFDELYKRVFEPATKVIVHRELAGEGETLYSARHQLIAEIVFDRKIGSERRRAEYYLDLIKNLDLGYSSDADSYRKLTRGQNKQLLGDFHDPTNRRDVMRALVKINPTDPFVQQHAAMMELQLNNLEEASRYLNTAISLKSDDFAIRDTEGKLALLIADREDDKVVADSKYARAEEIYLRNVQRRSDEPFGYRHLAETYVHWAKLHEGTPKYWHYLGLAYSTLLDSVKKCGVAPMLLQYQGELEELFGKPEKAREAFAAALKAKPGDTVTRLMAARLAEREGCPDRAIEILRQGVSAAPQESELHFRLALLMAESGIEDDAQIRAHFEAALLGPQRNYWPRLAYAAYLISCGDFKKANEHFSKLSELVVSNRERFEVRRFRFGRLGERHSGRVVRLSHNHGFVEFDRGAMQLYFPINARTHNGGDVPRSIGEEISYEIGFTLRGATAIKVARDHR